MTYFPVDPRARLTLGLRGLDLVNWFEFDSARAAELADKERLLDTSANEVIAQLPTGLAGATELAELARQWLLTERPEWFEAAPNGAIRDRALQRTVAADARSPLVAICRLVQEDLVVMSRIEGEWVLTAAVVCAPSRWRLSDKVGRGLDGIHQPVPGYQAQIAEPVSAMFDKITVAHPMWRANWTLLDDPTLFQPESARPRPLAADDSLPDRLFFRVERQTIRKLPASGDIAFTIRTYVRSLSEVLATEPDGAVRLAAALQAASAEHVAYRGWQEIRPLLLDWLDSRGTAV